VHVTPITRYPELNPQSSSLSPQSFASETLAIHNLAGVAFQKRVLLPVRGQILFEPRRIVERVEALAKGIGRPQLPGAIQGRDDRKGHKSSISKNKAQSTKRRRQLFSVLCSLFYRLNHYG
jgi:hypothetical protein